MKKFLSLVLASFLFLNVCLPLGNFPVFAQGDIQANISWYNSSAAEYYLNSAEDLFGFLYLMKSKTSFAGKTVYLMNDITVNTEDLSDLTAVDTASLIPWVSGDKNFAGTFDGNNHTISGIYYVSSESYSGLFGKANGTSNTVKNLAIVNSCIISSGSCVGALFGSVRRNGGGAVFSNLYVDVDLYATNSNLQYCGGLIGIKELEADGESVKLNSCVYAGNIVTEATPLGIGGLIGHSENDVRAEDCAMYGSVCCNSGTPVGGLVGSGTALLTLQNCVSTLAISEEASASGALYGTQSGTVTLKNNLYTSDGIRPYPKRDGTAVDSVTPLNEQYAVVEKQELHGINAMATLSEYHFQNWKARLGNFAVPNSLIAMKGVKSESVDKTECTRLVGYQLSAVHQGTFRLRLVAVVDSLQYSAVGFQIHASGDGMEEKMHEQECTTVYETLLGYTENGVRMDYSAEDLGGAYIFALNINHIPTDIGTITFEVRTYHRNDHVSTYDEEWLRFSVDTDAVY